MPLVARQLAMHVELADGGIAQQLAEGGQDLLKNLLASTRR